MKRYTLYLVCLLMLGMAVSCKKENKDNVLQARMTDFHASKAYIDNQNYSCFQSGEEINVNNQNCTVTPNLQDSSRSCNISSVTHADGYYAFYPSSLLASAADISDGFHIADKVVLPQTQDFVYDNTLERQVINNPMAGHLEASSGTILLQNLCALLKITVKATTSATINSIDVTLRGTTIWGTGHVDENDWSLVMDGTQQGTEDHSTVTLSFGTTGRQGNPSGENYYIVVPKTTVDVDNTNSIQVKINGLNLDNSLSQQKTYKIALGNSDDRVVAKNTIRTLPNVSVGYQLSYNTKCVFTVNAQGKKVTFAPRFLLYNKGTDTWSCSGEPSMPFHPVPTGDNDYDFYFKYSNNLIGNDNVWCWTKTISGAPPRTWRILTKDEWDYIFKNSRNNTKSYEYNWVNYTYGLILYPDGYSGSYPSGGIQAGQWSSYENNGCIFMAGRGCGSSQNNTGNGLGHGYYAVANSYNGTNYLCLEFNGSKTISYNNVNNTDGVNVWLVHDLN